MASVLKDREGPAYRPTTATPTTGPSTIGPRSKQLATGTLNYHSTSLRNMVSNTVNKTSLHPAGVQCVPQTLPLEPSLQTLTRLSVRPVNEHTELEEELLETANLDYNRVAIVCEQSFQYCNNPPLIFSGSQPLRRSSLRRCLSLRDWLSHYIEWCSDCILGKEDWKITP